MVQGRVSPGGQTLCQSFRVQENEKTNELQQTVSPNLQAVTASQMPFFIPSWKALFVAAEGQHHCL